MKKALCMIALAAITSGSVFAYGLPSKSAHETMQTDTTVKKTKKVKTKTKKVKKDTTMKM